MRRRLLAALLCVSCSGAAAIRAQRGSDEWSRFRGPNGSGVSNAARVPVEFGPATNLLWRTPLPPGHSSPILFGGRIYLTGFRGDALLTIALDAATGAVVWEKEAPPVRTNVVDKRNNPASPSPAIDDSGVYVFFPDYGLLAYDASGAERWRMPLGPFNNIYGMGASPIVVGDLVVLSCDQSTGSFLLAVDKRTGRERWRTPRPEARSGHSTPIVWRAADGQSQILLPGSFLLTAYDAASGAKRWWVRGLSFELKSVPVVSGDTLYINGYGSTENEPGSRFTAAPAEDVFRKDDANGDGRLQKTEVTDARARGGWFGAIDLDGDGALSRDEWEYYRAALESENGLMAIKLGGAGDMTGSAIRWKYRRSVPQLPSPLLYRDVLYIVNDGGIVTTLNPDTGEVIKQGRLSGALDHYFASPIAADGHVYFTSERGSIAVLEPTGDLTPIAVNQIGEDCYATPAVTDGRIYVRSRETLWAFGPGPG
jgi:outer membrane protein assembly factor BamB